MLIQVIWGLLTNSVSNTFVLFQKLFENMIKSAIICNIQTNMGQGKCEWRVLQICRNQQRFAGTDSVWAWLLTVGEHIIYTLNYQ